MKIRFVDVFYWLAIIVVDILIGFILAMFLMNYEDSYNRTQGEFWSLSSMNWLDKTIYISYISWIGLNIIGTLYIGYKGLGRIIKML